MFPLNRCHQLTNTNSDVPPSFGRLTGVPLDGVAEDLGAGSLKQRDTGVVVLVDIVVADGTVVARTVQQDADLAVSVHLVAVDDQVVAPFRRNWIRYARHHLIISLWTRLPAQATIYYRGACIYMVMMVSKYLLDIIMKYVN